MVFKSINCQATGTGPGDWDWGLGLGTGIGDWGLGNGECGHVKTNLQAIEGQVQDDSKGCL